MRRVLTVQLSCATIRDVPHAVSRVPALVLTLILMTTYLACGGGSDSGPVGPSSATGNQPASTINTFVGRASLPNGQTGLLAVRAASSLAQVPVHRLNVLALLLELVEPRLRAQNSTASGALTLENGEVINLAGTHSGGTYQLSGDGGYTVNVSESNGSLTGTVMTPSGPGAVVPFAAPAPSGPLPADPAGFYRGSYEMNIEGYFVNTIPSTGAVARSCTFRVRVTGTLTAEIFVPAGMRDTWAFHVKDAAREFHSLGAPCSAQAPGGGEVTLEPGGALGFDYMGDLTKIQAARVERVVENNITNVRTHTFAGALGGPAIEARFTKSFRATSPGDGGWAAAQGYPATTVNVTLRK
jgi:hypothetical protein